MINHKRRVFLEQSLGLTGAMFILPAVNSFPKFKPSIVKNNSDDPLFNNNFISANEIEDKTEIIQEPLINQTEINNQILELRKYAKNAPSSEEIARQHDIFKRKGVLEKIIDSTDRLKINSKYLEPILCIEQGSPYKQADYGLNWISPSGCRGIAQLSFGAFFDVIRWYNEQNLTQEFESQLLNVFLKSYRKYNYEFLAAKKTLTQMMLDETFSEHEKLGLNLVEHSSELDLLEKSARRYLEEDFNKLFLGPRVNFGNTIYDTTAVQIEIMAAYLKKLHEPLANWDFAVGAYNHGLGTTRALVSKYEGRPISISSLGDVIEQRELDYLKLFKKKGMDIYFNDFKERKNLSYMDKNYPLKVKIAELELKLI